MTSIRLRNTLAFVVVMTAEDTMRSAVEAMKRGAADYLGKPFDLSRVERIVRDLSAAPAEGADLPGEQMEKQEVERLVHDTVMSMPDHLREVRPVDVLPDHVPGAVRPAANRCVA